MKYYLPDNGDGPENAQEVKLRSWQTVSKASEFAEYAAEKEHYHDCFLAYPITISVILDDGSEEKFLVEREDVPQFNASRV